MREQFLEDDILKAEAKGASFVIDFELANSVVLFLNSYLIGMNYKPYKKEIEFIINDKLNVTIKTGRKRPKLGY